ncbi:MAG: chloride channel protein [Acidobacteriota bacterium]
MRLDWFARPFDPFLDPNLSHHGRWILLSILVGTVSGIGAILFDLMFRLCQWVMLEGIGTFLPPGSGTEGGPGYLPEHPWMLPVSLLAGGLLSGALVYGLAPEAEGHGTDAVVRSFHHLRGKIRRRVPAVKAVASAITIGSGGSGGREGPIAQIGAGFGSFVADTLKLTNHDRRILMMAGVAGGIGSIFRAPLGAALFAAEVPYSKPDFEYEVLLPSLISAITGYSIYSTYAGWGFLFETPPISFHEPRQLLVYAVLGLFCALVGNLYPRIFYGFRERVFKRLPMPRWLRPAAGALALGVIAAFFPQALGMGYGYIQEAIDGSHAIGFLLLFAAVKIIATSLTISSGGSGGVFGPSLVIGGALGAAFGQAATQFVPLVAPEPAACILVGMGGFFAGVARVPFASVIMVMEMTGSYGLLVPSLLVATIAFMFTPPWIKLYENQVPSRADSPAHLGSFAVEVLRQAKVRDCWEPSRSKFLTVRENDTLPSVVRLASDSTQNTFPVLSEGGGLVGELSIEDVRRALVSEQSQEGNTVRTVMKKVLGPLTPADDLAYAAQLLSNRQTDSVIVVRSRAVPDVLGAFTRRDLVVAYGKQIDRLHRREGVD